MYLIVINKNNPISENKLWRCVVKQCNIKLTESTYHTHILYHISMLGHSNSSYVFKCPHKNCNVQYTRPAGIKAHIKSHRYHRYFCYICQETAANTMDMLKHFTSKHCTAAPTVYTKTLFRPANSEPSEEFLVANTQLLTNQNIEDFGKNLILEWQRKKASSKTHFKSSEIELLPMQPIFQREIHCGECTYKTKVRTNMYRHLLMHKQNYPGAMRPSGDSVVASVDPVNPVPCLNSNERHFDKMTNLASSSLLISSSSANSGTASAAAAAALQTPSYVLPYMFVDAAERLLCGCSGCDFKTKTENILRRHWASEHADAKQYACPHCKEMICKARGISAERVLYHFRLHDKIIHRCETCNKLHYNLTALEIHISMKHADQQVYIVTYNRSENSRHEGQVSKTLITGKRRSKQKASST